MKSALRLSDAETLQLADVFDLHEAYTTALETRVREDRSGIFHPSAIGNCSKRQVLGFMNVTGIDTIDAKSFDIFDLGHGIHDLVQGRFEAKLFADLMRRRGLDWKFVREVKTNPTVDELYQELRTGGTTDGLGEISGPGWRQRGVLEIKSIGNDGFDDLKEPHLSHLMQAHLYAYRYNCPIIWVWYFNKNNSNSVVYTSLFKQEIMDLALEKLFYMNQHIDAETVPPAEESYMECKNCEYRDLCRPVVLGTAYKDRERKAVKLRKSAPLGGSRG